MKRGIVKKTLKLLEQPLSDEGANFEKARMWINSSDIRILCRFIASLFRSVFDKGAGLRILLFVCLSLSGSVSALAVTVYVDSRAAGAETGASWQDAFKSLGPALLAAKPNGEVWVAGGVYAEGCELVVSTGGLKLYGGFTPSMTERSERRPQHNLTILIGKGWPSKSGFRVMSVKADDVTLDGFRFAEGLGSGGGLEAKGTRLLVENCDFVHNKSHHKSQEVGGGANVFGDATFKECTFERNETGTRNRYGSGGGIYFSKAGGTLKLIGCIFDRNVAHYPASKKERSGYGGAVMATGDSMTRVIMDGCVLGYNPYRENSGMIEVRAGSLEIVNGLQVWVDPESPGLIAMHTDDSVKVDGAETVTTNRVDYKALTDAFHKRQGSAARFIATLMGRRVVDRDEFVRLDLFLEEARERLLAEMPVLFSRWALRSALARLDRQGGREALDALLLGDPQFESTAECAAAKRDIFVMKSRMFLPAAMHFNTGSMRRNITRLMGLGDMLETHAYIRDTLWEQGESVRRSEDDRNLYEGTKAVFRRLISEEESGYRVYLADYLRRLKSVRYDSVELAQRARALRLVYEDKLAAVSLPTATVPSLVLPKAFPTLRPLVRVPIGLMELSGAWVRDQMGLAVDPWSLMRPISVDGDVYIQNSAMIACLRGDEVLWAKAIPVAASHAMAHGVPLAGSWSAMVAGESVVGRYAGPSGMVLSGHSRRDGEQKWIFDPEDARVVSDPVALRGRLCCVQALDLDDVTGLLLVLDANSGKEFYRVRLMQRPTTRALRAGHVAFSAAENLPPPVVAGNMVYVATLGGIAAVDVMDRSVRWIRTYPQESDTAVIGARCVTPPIVGQENLLMASVDARDMLLLDRATGEVEQTATETSRREVAPVGINSVVILDDEGASFYSLADLRLLKRVRAPDLRYVQALRDGCVMSMRGALFVFSEAGKVVKKTAIPKDTIPIACEAGRVYACSTRWPGAVGVLTTKPRDKRWRLKRVQSCRDLPIPGSKVIPVTDGCLFRGENLLRYVDGDEKRVWDMAIAKDAQVWNMSDSIVIRQFDKVFFVDPKGGSIRKVWPEPEARQAKRIVALSISGNTVYPVVETIVDGRRSTNTVFCLETSGKAEVLGRVRAGIEDFGVVSKGKFLLGRIQRCGLLIWQPRVASEVKATDSYDFEEVQRVGGYSRYVLSPDGSVAWVIVSGQEVLKVDEKGLENIDLTGRGGSAIGGKGAYDGKLDEYPDPITWHDSVLEVPMKTKHGSRWKVRYVIVFDTETGRPYAFPSSVRVTSIGRQAWCVERMLDKKSLRCTTLSFGKRGGKGSRTITDLEGPNVINFHFGAPVRIGLQTVVFLYTKPDLRKRRALSSSVWFVDKPADKALSPFPLACEIYPLPGGRAALNRSVVGMKTFDAILASMAKSKPSFTTFKGTEYADGFLDEWSQDSFFSEARGGYATVFTNASVYIGVQLRASALIRLIAKPGTGHNLKLTLATGAAAGFEEDNMKQQSYLSSERLDWTLKRDQPVEGVAFAYAVGPAVDWCTLEIRVDQPPMAWKMPVSGSPLSDHDAALGDLAFRLMWRENAWSPYVNLLKSDTRGPNSFSSVVRSE